MEFRYIINILKNILIIPLVGIIFVHLRVIFITYRYKARLVSMLRIMLLNNVTSQLLQVISSIFLGLFNFTLFAFDSPDKHNASIPHNVYEWVETSSSVMFHTGWLSNTLLICAHSIIRLSSVVRPLQYRNNFTTSRITMAVTAIWTVSICLNLGSFVHRVFFDKLAQIVSFISVLITLITYVCMIGYLKLMKSQFKRAIPESVIHSALSSFMLCSADIVSSIFWIFGYYKMHKLDDNPDATKEMYDEAQLASAIYSVVTQLRVIAFPILLQMLFSTIRHLFWGSKVDEKNSSVCVPLTVTSSVKSRESA
ncbi:hypothetical protein PMAYCL1PPCAC_27298, partial [Pristionchus mayeri]